MEPEHILIFHQIYKASGKVWKTLFSYPIQGHNRTACMTEVNLKKSKIPSQKSGTRGCVFPTSYYFESWPLIMVSWEGYRI
ncbi:hypothetical protein, partial [Proteus mirabilis]|uniref:hypothetical protein n=1 Tax=Proteus mirabilis TaxID=584 RepID=UPI001C12FB98